MENHPIPQQISSYQFRLVGDMTLKQFFQLAGGIVVGLLFYSLPVIGIVKWPFVILSVLLGIALAFLPFEERPLERWIFAFFRAIYSPTSYTWTKSDVNQKFFLDEDGAPTPQVDAAMNAYLGKSNIPTLADNLDTQEKSFFAKLTDLFNPKPAPTPTQNIPAQTNTPTPVIVQPTATPVTTPVSPTVAKPAVAPALVDIKVPETPLIKIIDNTKPKVVTEEKPATQPLGGDIYASKASPVIMGEEMISSKVANFSVEAAPPNPPSGPNLVVGQVVTNDGKIVEGAIMEIKDSLGRPIRALRSNKLGHFVIVTPLENGHYDIVTEKEGITFETVGFDATGNIIPPILVKAAN